ncbi:endoglucanase [Daedaleopsis nitida]|nr:endoglucanase [Daedaleopsis nitida]
MHSFARLFVAVALALSVSAQQAPVWGQCGGTGWSGATACTSGSVCTELNDAYSQCVPGAAAPAPSSTVATSSAPAPTSSCAVPAAGAGKLRFAGVNMAGFDFGCSTDGMCSASGAWPPLTQYYGADGEGQMKHFVDDDGFNVFRLPVGWQFFTGDVLGSTIVEENFAKYDALVQACLNTGASCIIDLHNYARFNGKIIGQGGPTNEEFAAIWTSIASRYANNDKIIFGVMNEPHDVPDIEAWGQSVQAAVTAIREAGATSQLILLPGNNWTSAETFVSNGSAAALAKVKNPDGSITGLIFDVHKYLDADNSGTHEECVTNNIDNAWAPLAEWLRCNGRQAFNTETGGGNVASCQQFMCEQVAFQNANSDVFLGYVGWAAGNFYQGYVLGEVPTSNGNTWTDTSLVASCLAPNASK